MIERIVRHPWYWVAALLALTVGFAVPASRVRIDPSVEGMVPSTDPELVFYRGFLQRFGSDEYVVVGLRARRMFSAEQLDRIGRIARGLEQITLEQAPASGPATRLIEDVISLRDFTQIGNKRRDDGENALVVAPLVSELPRTPAEEADLWQKAVADPLIAGQILSEPETDDPNAALTTVILGRIVDRPGDLEFRGVLHERARELLLREAVGAPGVERVDLAGTPILKSHLAALTERDGVRADVIGWGINLAILSLIFSFARGVWLPLVPVILAGIWAIGFVALRGEDLNVLSVLVLPLIKVVGVATSVHLLTRYFAISRESTDRRQVAAETLRRVALPCSLASLTTAAGFLSLTSSDILPVREIGLTAAFGMLALWLLALVLIPVIILALPRPDPERDPIRWSAALNRLLDGIASLTIKHPRRVLMGGGLLTTVALIGVARISVETNLFEYLDRDDPVRSSYSHLQADLGGVEPYDIVLRAPDGDLLEPIVLARLQRIQAWLRRQPEVGPTLSIVDILERLNQEIEGGSAEHRRLPATAEQAASLLFLYENDPTGSRTGAFLQPHWEAPVEARISARVGMLSSSQIASMVERTREMLRAEASESAASSVEARPTGVVLVAGEMMELLVHGQIWSFSLAFAVVWVVVVLLLRSFWGGTIAMIPNLFPIVGVIGVMGLCGVSLNLGTALIASICIGIAVDDTIHFLVAYRRHLAASGSSASAIRSTMREVGSPIVMTSIVISVGMLSVLTSGYSPVRNFGALTATAMLLALLGDLFLLPAALLVLKPRLSLPASAAISVDEVPSVTPERRSA